MLCFFLSFSLSNGFLDCSQTSKEVYALSENIRKRKKVGIITEQRESKKKKEEKNVHIRNKKNVDGDGSAAPTYSMFLVC